MPPPLARRSRRETGAGGRLRRAGARPARLGLVVPFAHSPSGGGPTAAGDGTPPAWDLQRLLPGAAIGREYRLEMRLVFKHRAGRTDVLAQVGEYLGRPVS